MTIELVIEATLAALLFIASIAAIRLSHRLKKIRQGQEDLAKMIERFDEASTSARENLHTMKNSQTETEMKLQTLVKRATGLVNELSVMVNAGDNIAGRLEGAVDEVRLIGSIKPNKRSSGPKDIHQS